jgi:hypothetical protein
MSKLSILSKKAKLQKAGEICWFIPVEIGKISVQDQPRQKVRKETHLNHYWVWWHV